MASTKTIVEHIMESTWQAAGQGYDSVIVTNTKRDVVAELRLIGLCSVSWDNKTNETTVSWKVPQTTDLERRLASLMDRVCSMKQFYPAHEIERILTRLKHCDHDGIVTFYYGPNDDMAALVARMKQCGFELVKMRPKDDPHPGIPPSYCFLHTEVNDPPAVWRYKSSF